MRASFRTFGRVVSAFRSHITARARVGPIILSAFIFFGTPTAAGAQEERILPELLEMSIEELMNLEIVTAGKELQKVSETPASIVILTRQDIEDYGFGTLEDILQNIPGLYGIYDHGEGGILLGVRGYWSGVTNDNLIVLVNGVPQTRNALSSHPIPEIPVPVEAIDRIEVVRGPMSVVYGSGAFFGAINIITDDALAGASGNYLAGAVGSSGTAKVFARSARQGADYHFSVNASYERAGGVDVAAREMMSDPSALLNWGLSEDWRTGGALESERFFFNFSGSLDDLSFDLVVVESHHGVQFQFPSFTGSPGQELEYSDFNFSVGYRPSLTEKLTLDAKVTYDRDGSRSQYHFLFEDFFGFQQLGATAVEATGDLFFRPGPGLTITSGVYFKRIMTAYNSYDLPDFGVPDLENGYFFLAEGSDIETRAFYTQIQATPFEGFQIVAGARLEQSPKYELRGWEGIGTEVAARHRGTYDREEVEFIPRLALMYHFNENNVIKALFGKAINRPSFFKNYLHVLKPERPDLEPEDIATFELNYLATPGDKFSLNISYFHNTLDDLLTRIIILDENGDYDDSWFANAGRMVTDGVEVTVAARPTPESRIEVGGTYQNTRDRRDGFEEIDVGYSPKFLAHFKARTRLPGKMTAALTGLYVSGMETFWDETPMDPEGGVLDPIGRIGDGVGGYLTLDANLRIRDLFRDGMWVNFRLSNILNTEVRYPTTSNNPWADRGAIGFGRRLSVGLGLVF